MEERLRRHVDLPGEYTQSQKLDLGADQKINAGIQVSAVLIAGLAVGLVLWLDLPVRSSWSNWILIPVTVVLCVIYMVIHELTHGVAIRILSGVKPTYRVRVPFLTTGSDAYLTKNDAIVTALAPVLIWGLVLMGLLVLLPNDFLLSIYIVTALNFASSTGDYFQAGVFAKLPSGALIQDTGEETRLFLPG